MFITVKHSTEEWRDPSQFRDGIILAGRVRRVLNKSYKALFFENGTDGVAI